MSCNYNEMSLLDRIRSTLRFRIEKPILLLSVLNVLRSNKVSTPKVDPNGFLRKSLQPPHFQSKSQVAYVLSFPSSQS